MSSVLARQIVSYVVKDGVSGFEAQVAYQVNNYRILQYLHCY
jgi:hypothetical protein